MNGGAEFVGVLAALRPSGSRSGRSSARFALGMVVAVVAASCSGGDGASPSTNTPGSTSSVAITEPDAPGSSTTTPTDPGTPTTMPASTTTAATASTASTTTATTVPPEPYRAGVVFDDPVEVLSVRPGLVGQAYSVAIAPFHIADLGEELWVIGGRWNSSVAARSFDDGRTWTEVSFAAPPATGETIVEHVARGADGRYVAIARRETSCELFEEIEGGFTRHFVCKQRRPVVFVSDDGANWTESTPAGLAPPDGSSLRINDLITVGDRFVAAGTVEGSAWRAVLFSSPDGLTWTAERSIVGADSNPMSSKALAYDGSTLVFIANESPCAGVNFNTAGWDLGAGVAKHGRIFVGADVDSLTLQQPSDHPLAAAPFVPPDPANPCGPVDGVPFNFAGVSPGFDLELIDGALTVFENGRTREQRDQLEAARDADDEELYNELVTSIGTRRWAQLVDGEWVVTDIVGVNVDRAASWATSLGSNSYTAVVSGGPASIRTLTGGPPVHDVFTVTDDVPAQVRSTIPIAVTRPIGTVGVDGGYLLFGVQARDPFLPYVPGDPARVVAWRATSGEGPPLDTCALEPGGYCVFSDLRQHPDYPDFSGRDLSGVDLTGTDIGEAVFDGADLSGASLRLVTSDRNPDASFVGADLTGAQAQRAEMGDISGALVDGASFVDSEILRADGVDFSNTAMFEANLWDLTGVTFGNTDLTGARLDVVDTLPDLTAFNYETIWITVNPSAEGSLELDLSGLDLTGVTVSGGLSSDPAVVTSLDGTVLTDTVFRSVDLTQIDPTIDLSTVNMQFGVICPDGGEPDGLPRSCDRDP
ncbi:MAG: pentapeptide repeat-containing protein [Ilumatobacteraceae bacterium]|nr:pentapeptide repeat-containing protein [Ilumatobacteraceae bacterium]